MGTPCHQWEGYTEVSKLVVNLWDRLDGFILGNNITFFTHAHSTALVVRFNLLFSPPPQSMVHDNYPL